jgi:hypothetical protein
MFQWIQITQEEAIELEEQGIIPRQAGYRYQTETGQAMVDEAIVKQFILTKKAGLVLMEKQLLY